MLRIRSNATAALLCMIVLVPAHAESLDAQIDALIATARMGQTTEALSALQTLAHAHPTFPRIAYDMVVVATWAGAHEVALQTYERLREGAPLYVKAAAALSYRRVGRFERAEALYRTLLSAEPANREAQAGLVLSQIGGATGTSEAANLQIAADTALGFLPESLAARAERQWVPLLEALAMTRERQARYPEALLVWQTLLRAAPESTSARRAIVFVASRLGAATIAQDLADTLRETLGTDARLKLRQDVTATSIRWGNVQQQLDAGAARFGWTDHALATNIEDRNDAPQGSALAQNADFDRMLALRDRVLMRDVITLYRQLSEAQVTLPDYVIAAAADAYLYEREPNIAGSLYQEALKKRQQSTGRLHPEWQFSLFWALLECERWQEAQALAQTLWQRGNEPISVTNKALADPALFTRASVVRALSHLYADELRPASALLEDLRELAPYNLSIRNAYAAWLQSSGQRFANNEMLHSILTDDPEYLSAQIALADSEFSLARFASAQARADALGATYPENRAVQRTVDTLAMHRAPELKLSTQLGEPRGEAVRRQELRVDAVVFSSPLYENYRGYAHWFETRADIGTVARRERAGLGVERRAEGLDTSLEFHADTRAPDRRIGLALQMNWWPSDVWRVRTGIDTNTLDVPLRATEAGVHARQLSLDMSAQYAFSASAVVGLNTYQFSDGNRRLNLRTAWQQRLVEGPLYRLDGDIAAYASRNTRSDVAYFSPRRDYSVELALTNEWRTWRFYESSLMQRLNVSVGEYWQEGYATLPTYGMRYEHEWDRQRYAVVRYGVAWNHRPYDGKQQSRVQAYLDFDWRLR